MKNRKYYRSRFADYPDVLTVPQFCNMMGGICDKTARKLIHENHVKQKDLIELDLFGLESRYRLR